MKSECHHTSRNRNATTPHEIGMPPHTLTKSECHHKPWQNWNPHTYVHPHKMGMPLHTPIHPPTHEIGMPPHMRVALQSSESVWHSNLARWWIWILWVCVDSDLVWRVDSNLVNLVAVRSIPLWRVWHFNLVRMRGIHLWGCVAFQSCVWGCVAFILWGCVTFILWGCVATNVVRMCGIYLVRMCGIPILWRCVAFQSCEGVWQSNLVKVCGIPILWGCVHSNLVRVRGIPILWVCVAFKVKPYEVCGIQSGGCVDSNLVKVCCIPIRKGVWFNSNCMRVRLYLHQKLTFNEINQS
jgi:hypothetical protein